jgi:hypothetical protein
MRGALLPLLPLAVILLVPQACRFGYEAEPALGTGALVGNAGETTGLAGGGGSGASGSGANGGFSTNGGSSTSGGADSTAATGGDTAGATDGMAGAVDTAGAAGADTGAGGTTGSGGSGAAGGAGGSTSSGGASAGGSTGRGGASAGGSTGSGGASGTTGSSGASGASGTSAAGAAGRGGASGAGAGGAGAGGAGAGNAGAGNGGAGGTGASLVVTTQTDEADAGATPTSPGSTGFSLREAITYANGQSGHPSITFASGVKTITLKSPLPVVQQPVDIKGSVALDASQNSSTSACLSVSASNVLIDSVEIHDCKGEPVLFSSDSSSNNQVSNCYLHNNKKALVVHGNHPTVFFDYVSFSAVAGIEIYATSAQVLANELVSNTAQSILVHDGASSVYLYANVTIGGTIGISVGAVTGVTAWHNTLASPSGAAFDIGTATSVDARNNIFYGGTYGILGSASQFSQLDYDLYFSNSSGRCSSCTPGSHSVFADPLFNNPSSLDYSLKTGSPAIDAGVDLGQDRNLSSPGLYNGNGPDLGFIEAG